MQGGGHVDEGVGASGAGAGGEGSNESNSNSSLGEDGMRMLSIFVPLGAVGVRMLRPQDKLVLWEDGLDCMKGRST